MADSIKTVWDSVGHTPLIRIQSLSDSTGCEILAKAEFLNPGGSIKDRAAKGIIEAAEKEGKLKVGDTLVEGTAGNTGIGLATLAAERGYRVIVSMPDNQSNEKYEALRALGVEVRAVPPVPFSNPNHFYHRAKQISESENIFWANQFENTANSDFHFKTTGPEVWEQTGGQVDVLVLAAGTGGTIGGVSRFLKAKRPQLHVVLADPHGSGLFCFLREGKMETSGSSITEGIGIMRVTANFKTALIDEAIRISDQEMLEMLNHVARKDGLLIGTSSALNLRAAFEFAKAHRGQGLRIVTVICDSATRYQSRVFNSDWLRDKGLNPMKTLDI